MKKLLLAVRSRTVWTIVGLVLLNGLPSARELVQPELLPYLNLFVGLLAVYFRVNPQAK